MTTTHIEIVTCTKTGDLTSPWIELNKVVNYRNKAVVARYQKDFELPQGEAEQLFDDVKTFLWLASVEGVVAPPPKIDAGWHTFLLFTEDYQVFCTQSFGRFLHHRPTRSEDKPDGGWAVKKAVAGIEKHFGGFGRISKNWLFPNQAQCSSDSVSCAPSPSCDSGVNAELSRKTPSFTN